MKSFLSNIDETSLDWQPGEMVDGNTDSSMSSSSFVTSDSSSDESMMSIDENRQHHHHFPQGQEQNNDNGDAMFVEGVEDIVIQNDAIDEPDEINNLPENVVDAIRVPVRARPQHETHEQGQQSRVLYNLRNHTRSSEILFRVARCEELPLIRADIDWNLVHMQLSTYPAAEVEDLDGEILLQSILRMDPPCHVIDKTIQLYPKSCVNMDSFYVACQYASDEAAQLIMRRTMQARQREGIQWGMLAFLGDARISIHHARLLLLSTPKALVDPEHGVFGISPLDRMISGAFIHGVNSQWVEKLKLALYTAERGTLEVNPTEQAATVPFYPFHYLIGRLCSKDFKGVQFGALAFVNTLNAFKTVDSSAFLQRDQNGNQPLHIALRSSCDTNLGVVGERKLIKTLLNGEVDLAISPDGKGDLPLRLCIKNGWPCYDLITKACPRALEERIGCNGDLSLHTVLNGTYHARFGIGGARRIVDFFLAKNPNAAGAQNNRGELPLHLSIRYGWPCHDMLVSAAPLALETRDVTSKLYPFQISAMSIMRRDELFHLSVLYELMRESPLMLHGLASSQT